MSASSPLDRVRHAAGAILMDGGSAAGWTVVGETLQCCHCGKHFVMVPGSGHERGFCLNCQKVHCGGPLCWACLPQEQWLLLKEKQGKIDTMLATSSAERAAGEMRLQDQDIFNALVESMYASRVDRYERAAAMDANLRAIRG